MGTGLPLKELVRLRRLVSSGEAKSIRLAAGVSCSEMSREIGGHSTSVWKWENGTPPRPSAVASRYLALLDELAATAGSAVTKSGASR